MKTYQITYGFEGSVPIEAESANEARWKFQQYTAIDLARFAADSLKVHEVIEEGKEPEGLSRLRASDWVRI